MDGDTPLGQVKIFETAITSRPQATPGSIAIEGDRMFAGTSGAPLEILSIQPPANAAWPWPTFCAAHAPTPSDSAEPRHSPRKP